MGCPPDRLARAKDAAERRLDEIAESHAGRPPADVLAALERAVRRAGGDPAAGGPLRVGGPDLSHPTEQLRVT